MPYLAPEAAMPITSWAPRLAEIKARPHTHAGMDRPARKKSVLVRMYLLRVTPIPSTNAKYTSMMIQSIAVSMSQNSWTNCSLLSCIDRYCEQGGGSNLPHVLGKSVKERVVVRFRKNLPRRHGDTEKIGPSDHLVIGPSERL